MATRRAHLALFTLLAGICPALVDAQTTTTHKWTGPNPGEWGVASNWSTFLVPNSGNDLVIIDNPSLTALTTTIALSGSPFTARRLAANNATPNSGIVLGDSDNPDAQSLTLLNDAGTTPAINVSEGFLQIASSVKATQGLIKNGNGTLLLTGPVSGDSITLDGGELTLSGASSITRITHKIAGGSAPLAAGATISSTLRLLGSGVVPPGSSLTFDFGNKTLTANTLTATVDLGGMHRSISSLVTTRFDQYSSASRDSTAIIDIQNGSLDVQNLPGIDLSLLQALT